MYNPLYGMEAPGTGYKSCYKYRQHNTRADHHAFLHTFRTFVQFLDQSCPISPGTATAARRTRLTRYTWAWLRSEFESVAFAREIPDFPPLK